MAMCAPDACCTITPGLCESKKPVNAYPVHASGDCHEDLQRHSPARDPLLPWRCDLLQLYGDAVTKDIGRKAPGSGRRE